MIEGNQPLREPAVSATQAMTVTVYPLEQNQELIFAPPQPQQVSVPVNADIRLVPNPDDESQPFRAVSLLRSRVRIDPEAGYNVVSAISEASPAALRKDTGPYPAWVTERFLQLPGSVPDRVKGLAAEITANTDSAYDKANAIEKYLRTYKYNQGIAAPPGGQDGVDYFLFDVKEGYCDYYASAMVVMLRSVGVPARFVVGYTPGQLKPTNEQNDEGDQYRILERNAHAWPEVYFPSYGWVQFEPTASEPLLAPPPTRRTTSMPASSLTSGR